MDPQELKLDFNERTKFRDLETGKEIVTEPWHIQKDYQQSMTNFCDKIKLICGQNKIDYVQVDTTQPLDLALSEYLIKRKRVG